MLVTVLSFGVAIWIVKLACFPGQPFDADLWRTENTRSVARQRMADRLLARRSLIGLRRHQVVAMLGEPRDTEYFREWDMVYLLGNERGFISIDSEWLVLRLGLDENVIDARLVRD
jgi:hypothetical protein